MSIEENKAVVGRWFTEFWGKDFNPAVIDELAAQEVGLDDGVTVLRQLGFITEA